MSNSKAEATWHGLTGHERAKMEARARVNRAAVTQGRLSAVAILVSVLAVVSVIAGGPAALPLILIALSLTFTGRVRLRMAQAAEHRVWGGQR